MNESRTGVLLLNFGGPEKLEDVGPFLYNLFSDPEIVQIRPAVMRKGLAWCIAALRKKKSQRYYEQIGGGSPMRRITLEQAQALKHALDERGHQVSVYVGMLLWEPYLEEAIGRIIDDGLNHLVVLPLFPQFSMTTTGSCLMRYRVTFRRSEQSSLIRQTIIEPWFAHPLYVQSLAEMIDVGMRDFPDRSRVHVVFSAHSIPEKYVAKGDPYVGHTERTVELVMDALGRQNPYHIAFQSRVGPVRWLRPSTEETLRRLASKGVRQVLVVPISFVSDHVETLYEIDIFYRNLARELGITRFGRAPSFNSHPTFINALAELVCSRLPAVCPASASTPQAS